MRIENAVSLVSSLIPVDRASNAAEADWMRAHVLARIAVLAGVFVALPLALVASPQALGDVLGLFVALLGSAAASLLALKYRGATASALCGVAALGALVIGPWPEWGGEAAAAAVLVCGALDSVALPRLHPARRWLLAVAGLVAAALCALAWSMPYHDGEPIWFAGLPLLALPSLATLALSLSFARMALESSKGLVGAASRREEIMLGGAGVAVLMVDRGGLVADCTQSVAAVLDCDPDDVLGRGLFERMPIAGRPAFLLALSETLSGKGPRQFRTRLFEGASQAASSWRQAEFVLSMRVAMADAIAVRIERAADSDAGEANGAPDAALMKIISHEIRSPMHAILGFSSVLASSGSARAGADQVADYARIIHRSAREAYAVSNALVSLMQASSPDFHLDPQPVDLAEVLAGAVRAARERNPEQPGAVTVVDAAGDALADTDVHAVTTLVGALIEGFSAAFDGRAQVRCAVSRAGVDPRLVVTARAGGTVVSIGGGGPVGHFGVIEELSHRLAGAIGARVRFDLTGPEISARLDVPRVWSAPARPATPSESASVLPLRKSA